MSKSVERIALLISMFFPPEFGGGATGAWNRAMVLHKIGFSVYVLCGFPSYPTGKVSDPKYKGKFLVVERLGDFTLIRMRLIPLSHQGILKRMAIFMNFVSLSLLFTYSVLRITGRPDLVYARSPILFSVIPGYMYSKLTNAFFIFEVPDLWPEELVTVKSILSPLLMKIGRIFAKAAYSTPDVTVTVSRLAEKHIVEQYHPRPPVFGIPVGVDPSKFQSLTKSDARQKLLERKIIPESLLDKFIVLYSGLISEAQDVESLVKAAAHLSDPGIAVLIIGEGPGKKKIQQRSLDLKLDNVYFLSQQPREIMPTIISASDVCTVMLASDPIFDIALPTKFYEFLACRKPLLGVCGGELAEIIQSRKIGFVVNAGDVDGISLAIHKLKNSPSLMKEVESNCNSTVSEFTLDHVASQFGRLIENRQVFAYT